MFRNWNIHVSNEIMFVVLSGAEGVLQFGVTRSQLDGCEEKLPCQGICIVVFLNKNDHVLNGKKI
jgi:hypothetical protein